MANLLATRLDLPFYLRLPQGILKTWDHQYDIAGIVPLQHMGDVGFSKQTNSFKDSIRILDAPASSPTWPAVYSYRISSQSPVYGEVFTLQLDARPEGGFSEVRPYTEVIVFRVVPDGVDPLSEDTTSGAFVILNRFLDYYRLATQDPYVHRIDQHRDTYLIDFSVGSMPQDLNGKPSAEVLGSLARISFPSEIGPRRHIQTRLDTLDDLFPGKVLEPDWLKLIEDLGVRHYELPIYYDLLLNAQTELKNGHAHVSIVEAETAFEAFVAAALVRVSVANGAQEAAVLQKMEYPGMYDQLGKRINGLDTEILTFRANKGLPPLGSFKGSKEYQEWNQKLYKLRNRIVHAGWRGAGFDDAKLGIEAAKKAIFLLHNAMNDLADLVRIAPQVHHLQKTAGRLRF